MANTYKNIIITPNIGNTSDPKIVFSGANVTVNTDVSLFVYPASNGTLSFEGSAGQLFSITNDLSNLIFSVADVSGIPSLEVYANGLVSVIPFSGNVVFGNSTVNITANATGTLTQSNSTVNSTHTASLIQVANSTSTANLTALDLKIGATTVVNSTQVTATLHVGNVSGSYANITGQVNTATLYATTNANIASAVQANATGVYTTGTVNAASLTVGTAFTANSTVVNAVAYYSGTLLVANSTVSNATHLGGTAASGYQTTAGLSANVATLTSNNSTNFGGYTWAAPAALGGTTANSGAFTTLNASTSANVGANVQLTTSQLFIGNATVNSAHTSALLQVANSTSTANLVATGLQTYTNSTVNSSVTASLVQVSNSTATANLTATSLNIYANSTVNGSFTSTTVSVANSTGNVQTVPTSLTVQNSTVNSVMGLQSLLIQANTTVNGSITQALVQIANSTGNVQHSAISILAQTNTTVNSTMTAALVQVSNSTFTANLTSKDLTLGSTVVNSAQVTSTLFVGNLSGTYANLTGQVNAASLLLSTNTATIGTAGYFVSNGNIGIGQASPAFKLDITGAALGTTVGSQSFNQRIATSSVGNVDYFEITETRQQAGSTWVGAGTRLQQKIDSTWMGYIQFNGGDTTLNNGGLSFGTGTTTTSAVTIAERMRIDASGNVGIGNTAPASKLVVSGNVDFRTANILLDGVVSGGFYKGNNSNSINQAAAGNIFRVNSNTLTASVTFAAGENGTATGPVAVQTGISLIISTGARVSIV